MQRVETYSMPRDEPGLHCVSAELSATVITSRFLCFEQLVLRTSQHISLSSRWTCSAVLTVLPAPSLARQTPRLSSEGAYLSKSELFVNSNSIDRVCLCCIIRTLCELHSPGLADHGERKDNLNLRGVCSSWTLPVILIFNKSTRPRLLVLLGEDPLPRLELVSPGLESLPFTTGSQRDPVLLPGRRYAERAAMKNAPESCFSSITRLRS